MGISHQRENSEIIIWKKLIKTTRSFKVACWNVCTMLDSEGSIWPQRRSALVARELANLDTDIAALSEDPFPEEGSLTEYGQSRVYPLLIWKSQRRPQTFWCWFMIKKLTSLPVEHSDQLMLLCLPLLGNQFMTIISAYAPTLQSDIITKETFYKDLKSLFSMQTMQISSLWVLLMHVWVEITRSVGSPWSC